MLTAAALCISVIGCSGPAVRPVQDGPPIGGPAALDSIPDAIPRSEPLSKYGNPASYEVFGERYYVLPDSRGYKKQGRASWYGRKFHGQRTSSGEPYDMYAMTAAHRTLPLPTYVRVTNLDNGRQVVVRVNDRGPFHSNRIIDLSYTAAIKLDIVRNGTGHVEVEAIEPGINPAPPKAMPVVLQEEPAMTAQPVKAVAIKPEPQGFYLQAGAFGQRRNAEELAQRLRRSGLTGVEVFENGLDSFFRVRLGPYSDETLMRSDRQKLRNMGVNSHIHGH